jgi:hypothetical protein
VSDNLFHEDGTAVAKSLNSQIRNDLSPRHCPDYLDQDMTGQSDSLEIALDVLMTLGAGDHEADATVHNAPDAGDSEGYKVLSPLSTFKTTGNIGPVSGRVTNQLSIGRSIELLRHYRYKIAPWVSQIFFFS